ncbi:MAG: filamentous hemagglutinin N-terminal domain-containing protein [Acidobacteriota bacterium]|jgi:filamentous hemagglutinin family protein|nr:filamentous hemagglutinin N-terminal domain-containing protein [Acidobacteriota bacterium]
MNGRDAKKLRQKAAAAALMALLAPGQALLAQSGPQGAVVTSGVATVAQSGNVTNVNQTTERASINWQSFSVKAGEAVNFNQPGASSVTLNRVVGSERSVIEGALRADGQVFLLNSNGVLIAKGATVNAGGFVASALDLTDADFAAGRYVFKGKGDGRGGAVVNEGAVEARDGGYVALLGGSVSNRGVVTATRGTVAMASGDKIRLDFDGGGSLLGVAVDEGALDALVENRGAVVADGGRVYLTAMAASDLVTAQVNMTGSVQARTVGDLKGRIELYADGGEADVSGTLDASAPDGGDGGFVETSGDRVAVADGAVIDTHAARGADGEWLIDPDGFTIGSTANDGDVSAATLNAALAKGSVTIVSTQGSGNGGTNDGDINVNGALSWSKNTLTLTATSNVYVNNVLAATGTAGLTANYGKGANADGTPHGLYTAVGDGNARIDFTGTGALKLGGEAYTVVNTASQLAAARANPSGRYALGSDIDMSSVAGWTALDGGGDSGFTGKFNGLGHKIENFSSAAQSVFGTIAKGASVSNLSVTGTVAADSSSRKASSGVLADVNRGSVVNAAVSGGLYITDLANTATWVSAAGLLAGTNSGLISWSSAQGTIHDMAGTTGGFVGVNEAGGTILDSWMGSGTLINDLSVSAASGFVGGFVGDNAGVVRRAYAANTVSLTGATSSRLSVGGFVGRNTGTVAEAYTYSVSDNVSNYAPRFGGFVGENAGLIEDAYTTRFATLGANSSWDAGFAYDNSGTIRNAYATMNVVNNSGADFEPVNAFGQRMYGFAARNSGNIENAYWIGDSLLGRTAGAAMLSADAAASFASYAFGAGRPDVWGESKSGRPVLRNTPVVILSGTPQYGSGVSVTARGLQGGDSVSPKSNTVDAGVWDAASTLDAASYANVRGVVRVLPRQLTISGVVADRVYNGADDTSATLKQGVSGGGLQGLVRGETLSVVYTAAAFRDGNAGEGKTVDLAYTASDGTGASGGKLSNYVLPTTTAASITPKAVTATVAGEDKVYDGTTAATASGTVSGAVAGDDLSVSYAAASFNNKNAGNRTVTVSGIALSGADAGNYTLSGATTRTTAAAITPRPLQFYALAEAGAASEFTVAAQDLRLTNVAGDDKVTLSGTATASKDASTPNVWRVTDTSALKANNPNYTVAGSVGSVIVGDARLVFDRVAAGEATVYQSPSGKTAVVEQESERAVLDWLRFSLGAGETLVFNQPSSESVTLNRVVTDLPSVIEGTLLAKGRVFVLNARGVLFAAGSRVDVGGLLASAFDLPDVAGFMGGGDVLVFNVSRGDGKVVSAGDVVIADGGFLALAAKGGVEHSGSVKGGGDALLAATDGLTLTLDGLKLAGDDISDRDLTGAVALGGSVALGDGGRLTTAGDSVALTGGFTLDSLSTGAGGSWRWEQNAGITIGAGGDLTGGFVNGNLAERGFSLSARQGDIVVDEALAWSADTALGLHAGKDIYFNKPVTATGGKAGLSLGYGGDYHLRTRAAYSGAVLEMRAVPEWDEATGTMKTVWRMVPVAQAVPDDAEFASVTLSGADATLEVNGEAAVLIHSLDDLAALATTHADADGTATGYFALAQDIDATEWSAAHKGTPSVLAAMSGTLAGFGHTVSNLTLDAPTENNVALVGRVVASAGGMNLVRDIGVENVSITGKGGLGALAGSAADTVVSQAYSTGRIQGTGTAGGLVGTMLGNATYAGDRYVAGTGPRIERSYSDVAVSSSGSRLGGLVGNATTVTIADSHATGDVTGAGVVLYYVNRDTGEKLAMYDEYGRLVELPVGSSGDWYVSQEWSSTVGGLLGEAYYANVSNSWASGDVTALDGEQVGGLVGVIAGQWEPKPFPNAVTDSFATGDVLGGWKVGGLVGEVGYLLLAEGTPVKVDNVYATGNVIGTRETDLSLGAEAGGMIGGLIGSAVRSDIVRAYATGNVIAIADGRVNNLGGLVGSQTGGTVSNSAATGTVVGNGGDHVGGLVGKGGVGADNGYADAQVEAATAAAPARAETGRAVEDVRQEREPRPEADAGQEAPAARRTLDSRIDDGTGYSARVRSVTVEGEECADGDDSCEEER